MSPLNHVDAGTRCGTIWITSRRYVFGRSGRRHARTCRQDRHGEHPTAALQARSRESVESFGQGEWQTFRTAAGGRLGEVSAEQGQPDGDADADGVAAGRRREAYGEIALVVEAVLVVGVGGRGRDAPTDAILQLRAGQHRRVIIGAAGGGVRSALGVAGREREVDPVAEAAAGAQRHGVGGQGRGDQLRKHGVPRS